MSSARKKGSKSVVTGRRGHNKVTVKGRGRRSSSTRWLQRQLNDPYVQEAQDAGYRSRAAFKLIELDQKFNFLKSGKIVVDLGAAPGGWSQVAANRVGKRGMVLAVDIQKIDPIPGVITLEMDATTEIALESMVRTLKCPPNIVLSDMASRSTGHAQTDHLRVVALAELAEFAASKLLAPGGIFVAKVFKGGSEGELLRNLKAKYDRVKHAKPPASRSGSAEEYVVAQGFKKSIY
tara:strand:+ start:83342 stop:84046 length:705 start_codon:yes stop_codon:yes gene_type:complete